MTSHGDATKRNICQSDIELFGGWKHQYFMMRNVLYLVDLADFSTFLSCELLLLVESKKGRWKGPYPFPN